MEINNNMFDDIFYKKNLGRNHLLQKDTFEMYKFKHFFLISFNILFLQFLDGVLCVFYQTSHTFHDTYVEKKTSFRKIFIFAINFYFKNVTKKALLLAIISNNLLEK